MPDNLREVSTMSKQIHRRALPGVQTEGALLERRVRVTFVNAPSVLRARPEPRHRFDNAARRDNPTRPWADFAEPLRDVAIQAAAVGGAVAQEAEARIADAIVALLDYCTAPLREAHEGAAYDVVAREVPEAIDWMARAHLQPTLENLSRAHREVGEGRLALELHQATLRGRLTPSGAAVALMR